MRPTTLLTALALAVLAGAPTTSAGQIVPLSEADPADVATPEAVVDALYESIQRAPGDRYDWDRNLSLFHPTARLIPNPEQRNGQLVVHTPTDFRDLVDQFTTIGGPTDVGFREEQISSIVERYGDIAHVFSTYRKGWWDADDWIGRGINSIQLLWADDRWWITSMVWDEEVGAGPLPPRYLPGGADDPTLGTLR